MDYLWKPSPLIVAGLTLGIASPQRPLLQR
jgi:hypothetical protein